MFYFAFLWLWLRLHIFSSVSKSSVFLLCELAAFKPFDNFFIRYRTNIYRHPVTCQINQRWPLPTLQTWSLSSLIHCDHFFPALPSDSAPVPASTHSPAQGKGRCAHVRTTSFRLYHLSISTIHWKKWYTFLVGHVADLEKCKQEKIPCGSSLSLGTSFNNVHVCALLIGWDHAVYIVWFLSFLFNTLWLQF